ncbi:hypothetical protein H7X46_22770 [Pseudonocardia sp. C8]|uniref:hypothetical protein n=1 Tax=Pseudonocardia sp. C8 TaxID=2762759 RepID=UPI0016434566|nr:hypothetical protein [Pseudonocardia sp. C8]MBC3193888.1 hypothetical protein [Pseudonocardia sp. C8]
MTDPSAGAPLPGSPGATGPRHVVSVAELLARHSAAARDAGEGAGPTTGPVLSVGDLLRREGRTPVGTGPSDVPASGAPGGWPDIDLPQPRPTSADDGRDWPARPLSGRRRAAAVAGALVAAGSVLGAAIYNGAASHGSDARAAADGLFPGIGLPAATGGPETLPQQYLPANVALSSALPELQSASLPATAPGATDWMGVAFPRESAAAGTLRQVSTGSASDAAAAIPAQRSLPAPSGPSAGDDDRPSTGSGSVLAPVARPLNGPDRQPAGNLIEPLTAPAPRDGGTSTGPLQDATEPTRAVGTAAGEVVSPVARAAAPVGSALGGAVKPVTKATSPVTDAVKPVTRPVADTLEPVTTPVVGALSPVTEPVLGATEPLTGPLLDAAEPVTGLLDTSAKAKKQKKDSSDDGSGSDTGKKSGKKSGKQSGDSDATVPLETVTTPAGKALTGVTEPVGGTVSTVTEPVGGALDGVTKGAGSLLGGGGS